MPAARRKHSYVASWRDAFVSDRGVYQVLRPIGFGGNGETYLVIATSGQYRGIPLAAKLFYRIEDDERREEFHRETQTLRENTHPCIMRIFDSGSRDGRPFMIVEFLSRTLKQLEDAQSQATLADKLVYAVQLVSAVAFLAENGIVHRDIKPDNILVNGSSCVLGDFGLARRITMKRKMPVGSNDGEQALKKSAGLGMPLRYRTPDQVDYALGKRDIGTASDVFQVGLVLAELLTGRNPERPVERSEILSPIELRPLDPVPSLSGPAVKNLLEAMLTMDPDDRPSTDELLSAWTGLLIDASRPEPDVSGG